jgi:hypothetical protein
MGYEEENLMGRNRMERNTMGSKKRHNPPMRMGAVAHTIAVAVTGLIGHSIRLLAGSAQPTPADDELNSSIRGGVLNYRTGKLDDGTDPVGWYERD